MKVLFLCTGNSCRSQMAEAIVNHFMNPPWAASSAGTLPAGYVHPHALRVLEEIGINHQGESKHVDAIKNSTFDLVITVCNDAAENCPVWLAPGDRLHLGFRDPAQATGTEEEILSQFRAVRDQIQEIILARLKQYQQEKKPSSER